MKKEQENSGVQPKGLSRKEFMALGAAGAAALLAGELGSAALAQDKEPGSEKKVDKIRESGRLICAKRKAPYSIKEGKFPLWICACGLSKNPPFCDGSHKRTEGEQAGGLYVYSDKERVDLNP